MSEKLKINGKILTWTRNSLGMSIADIAKKAKFKTDFIEQLENGTKLPSFAQLKKLAHILKRPTAVFFLTVAPTEPEIPKDYRVLKESDIIKLAPKTIYEIRKAQRKREIALELAKDLGVEVPSFSYKATLQDDISLLSKKYRKLILADEANNLASYPEGKAFETWKSGLEKLGVVVFQASLDSLEEMRGLAIYEHEYPLILLNTKDSPKGKIFSLMHEFCHLLLHKSGIGNINPSWVKSKNINQIEVFCNAFASECLLPSDEFLTDIDFQTAKNNPEEINRLFLFRISNRFQASWEVVLRRFLDLKVITSNTYDSKRAEIKKFFEGKKKSSAVVPYDQRVLNWNGDFFTNLVAESFYQDKITAKDVADYLGAKFQHFEKIQKRLGQKNRGA